MMSQLQRRKDTGFPPPRGRRRASPAGGFSLIEVLAAFVILALVATALFELFGGALRNVGAADDWSRAVLVAESRLAETANLRPLREGAQQGDADDGRVKWTASVAAWEPPGVDPELARLSDTMTTRLYRIEVVVTFPGLAHGDRTFTLATVRAAEKDPK